MISSVNNDMLREIYGPIVKILISATIFNALMRCPQGPALYAEDDMHQFMAQCGLGRLFSGMIQKKPFAIIDINRCVRLSRQAEWHGRAGNGVPKMVFNLIKDFMQNGILNKIAHTMAVP